MIPLAVTKASECVYKSLDIFGTIVIFATEFVINLTQHLLRKPVPIAAVQHNVVRVFEALSERRKMLEAQKQVST